MLALEIYADSRGSEVLARNLKREAHRPSPPTSKKNLAERAFRESPNVALVPAMKAQYTSGPCFEYNILESTDSITWNILSRSLSIYSWFCR